MSDQTISTLVGLAVLLALRLIDYALPKGRHWTWIERWTKPDKSDDDPDAE